MLTEDLKATTYPEHQATEKKMMAALKKIESREDYVRTLLWLYGFYAPLEALIQKQDLLPDIEIIKRCRSEYLLQDIRASGLAIPAFDICRDLPEIRSTGQAMGALYVLEGSTLGGRIIAGMIQRQLGPTINTSYFSGYGEENSRMWQTYKDILDRTRTVEEQTVIIEAAKATFITFKNWIDKHELQPQL